MNRAFLLILMVLSITPMLFGSTLQEICAGKDVLACQYMDKLTLMDLKTGEEADAFTDRDLLDFTWNKAGNAIYALCSVHTDGPNYDDPGYDTIIIRKVSFPSAQVSELTRFRVKSPMEDLEYAFSSIYLNKDANLAIVLTYGMGEYIQWQYTYSFTTGKLSLPLKKDFVPFRDGLKRKGLPVVTNQPGKFYNKEDYGKFDIYTIAENGYEINVSNKENTHWGSIANEEPLYYCVSPDSTFILFGYNTDEEKTSGPTYAADVNGEKSVPVSYEQTLSYDFQPFWISGGRLVYYYKGASVFDHEKTSVNILGANAEVTVLKTYEDEDSGPRKIMFRYQSQ